MKRILSMVLVCALMLLAMAVPVSAGTYTGMEEQDVARGKLATGWYDATAAPDELYVSPDGDDNNDGSINSPFKTIERARDEVRKYTEYMSDDIVVNIASGRYELSDSIEFEFEDSGMNGHRVIYRGYGDTKPVISGAKQISGFTRGENGIWKASADLDFVRELSVNGVMAQRAKSANKIFGVGAYNPTYGGTASTANPEGMTAQDGIYVNKADLGLYENPTDVELKWDFAHQSALIHAKDIRQDPDNENQVIVELDNPEWNSVFNRNFLDYSAPLNPGWDVAFSVENAYELLDEPGEFYYNKSTKTLYYMPREGEDMTSAEVLCPQIDKLIGVKGRGYLNKLTNISFENLKFAHSTWGYLDDYSVHYTQAESPTTNFAPMMMTPGAFEVDWADGLSVSSCDFYGITTVALKLNEGVVNSNITGNTFADIGCGAILVGNKMHTTFTAPTSVPSGDAIVSFRKGWSASSQPKFAAMLMHYDYTKDNYGSAHTWTNADELAENPDAKSWVRWDLGKPYDISKIEISYANGTSNGELEYEYKPEEMSNFEILVSNDRDFDEYETVATYGENTTRSITVNETFSEEYRYVMVRKTEAEPFAMTCLKVYSGDEDRIGGYRAGVCVNNTIQNNYITRVGKLHTGAPGITAYYTEKLTIDHNTIVDVPYSGISLGWGWEKTNSTAKDNVISNNYIKDYMQQCNDGGGIYILGTNPGTTISGNYVRDGINGYGAIYFDSGSVGFTATDNVTDNTNAAMFQHDSKYSSGITITKTYTTFTDYEPYKGVVSEDNANYLRVPAIVCNGTECTADSAVVMLPNNYTAEAIEIALNAGLSSQHQGIAANVPDNRSGIYKGPYAVYANAKKGVRMYASYTNEHRRTYYYLSAFENILNNASFGSEPWQYPVEYKHHMEDILERVHDDYNKKVCGSTTPSGHWCRGVHIDEEYMMKYLTDSMIEAVSHLSYDEMLAICNDYIANAEEGNSFGQYQSGAKAELQTAVTAAEAMPKNTEADEYTAVIYLENALNTFLSKEYSDEVVYAYIKDATTEIDRDAKTVTITLPYGAAVETPVFTAKGDTVISVDGSLDLDAPVTLKAENSAVGTASTAWTLTITYDDSLEEKVVISPNADNWYNSNENINFAERNNALTLAPWLYPYMYKTPANGEVSFKVKADREDAIEGISFIVASKSGANLEYDGVGYYKNTYYKLSLKGQDLELYQVESGTPTLVTTANNVGFNYGDYNDISVSLATESGSDKMTVKVGDTAVLDNVTAGTIGTEGYVGVLTKSVGVNLIEPGRKYTYKFVDEDGTVIKEATVDYGATIIPPETNPTKEATAQYTYTFAGWEGYTDGITQKAEEMTFTAKYNATVNQYTYKFVDENGTVIKEATVDYGAEITPPESNPTKEATAQYTYTFAGWDGYTEGITQKAEEMTFTAKYNATVNQYTYKFVDEDGTMLKEATVDYGAEITPPESNPTKEATDQYTYTFAGWDGYTEGITQKAEEMTFTATYTQTVNQYTYKFVDDDGSTLKEATVDYGTTIVPPEAPADKDIYTFDRWDGYTEGMTVTENVIFTAVYKYKYDGTKTTISEDGKTFTIKVMNIDDGNTVLLALYNGNRLVDIKTDISSGEDLVFTTDRAYTSVKTMVWNSISGLKPVVDIEPVK